MTFISSCFYESSGMSAGYGKIYKLGISDILYLLISYDVI